MRNRLSPFARPCPIGGLGIWQLGGRRLDCREISSAAQKADDRKWGPSKGQWAGAPRRATLRRGGLSWRLCRLSPFRGSARREPHTTPRAIWLTDPPGQQVGCTLRPIWAPRLKVASDPRETKIGISDCAFSNQWPPLWALRERPCTGYLANSPEQPCKKTVLTGHGLGGGSSSCPRPTQLASWRSLVTQTSHFERLLECLRSSMRLLHPSLSGFWHHPRAAD